MSSWWDKDCSSPWSSVFEEVSKLNTSQKDYLGKIALAEKLYSANSLNIGTMASTSNPNMTFNIGVDGRLKYNIIRGIIDSLLARISTQRPKIRYLTKGGYFHQRRKAQLLNRFTSGLFYQSRVYDQGQEVLRDSCCFGTGYLHASTLGKDRIIFERVHPAQVRIDETRHGKPLAFYYIVEADRDTLKKLYPKKANLIEASGRSGTLNPEQTGSDYHMDDSVTVIEGWRPALGDIPGSHIIAVSGGCLVGPEPWESEEPGLIEFRWKRPTEGFTGESVIDEVLEIQLEINFLLMKIQEQMNLGALKILVDTASDVQLQKLGNNKQLGIVKYTSTGQPPQIFQIPPVTESYFTQIHELEAKAYKIIGISELFAQSQKPSGLNSGRALQEFEDIQSARFLHIGQAWQEYHFDIAEAGIELARHMANKYGSFKVSVEQFDELGDIDWKDIDLSKDSYRMQAWPVSLLPDSPPGQLQSALDYVNADPSMAPYVLDMLEYPDVTSIVRQKTAGIMLIEKILDCIIFGKEVANPDPFMDLQYGIQRMTQAYSEAYNALYDKPEERERTLELIRDWIEGANSLLTPPEPPAPPPGAPVGPEAPPGPPMEGPPMPPQGIPPGM